MFAPAGLKDDVQEAWRALRSTGPMVFSPYNGGHWIATRATQIEEVQKDWETYSHQSIVIPANPSPALPVESDPPRHTALRAIISPLFTPITLKKVEVQARQLCAEMVNELQPKGECE